jgi:hypothetical protein
MVAGAIAGNISAEATSPTGNTFVEAMGGSASVACPSSRGVRGIAGGQGRGLATINPGCANAVIGKLLSDAL